MRRSHRRGNAARLVTCTYAVALGAVMLTGNSGNTPADVPGRHHALPPVPVAAAAPAALPRTAWTVTADSQETALGNYAVTRAIDGDPATFWHTKWGGGVDPLPHTVTIDMHATNTVVGLTYLPRPASTGRNGVIGGYRIETSTNGTTWGAPVASGTLADDSTQKNIAFAATQTRYVRLTALTEAGNRGQWSSAAELNLLGSADPNLPRTGWTVAADSQETAAESGLATNAIDGNPATFWHTRWSSVVDPLPHTFTIDMHATNTVAGLSYLPRPAASRNGVIGGYRIETSTDGGTWALATSGTLADDSTLKTVAFTPVPTRYVRLTALTEAGNRGQWTSAAEINLLGATAPPPPQLGRWSTPVGFPLVPVGAALLPTGRLLTWSSFDPYTFGGSGLTQTATYDPATNAVTQRTVTETGHDMFCPGTAMLTDGRVLVNGGDDAAKTSIYDAATNTWTTGPAMTVPRGYNAATALADGRVLTLGGSWSGGQGGKDGEVWSPAGTWTRLAGAPVAPMLTADPQGVYRSDNHGWLLVTAGGRVLQAGPSRAMNWYGTAGTGSVTSAGTRGDDTDAMNGNAVMYDVGRILTVGGATAYQDADATGNAHVIDITSGSALVRTVASMANRRAYGNSVVLPDGTVLVVGGQSRPVPFSDATSVLEPELWNPVTERFTALAPMAVPRNYHSVAVLLPDGRVFSGGGGLCGSCGTNHPDGQIFTPPYLLNTDGTPAPRPAITGAPATVATGGAITLSTDRAVTGFSLVRLSSTTHSVNNDQRRIPLTPSATSGTTYTLPVPADRGVALPGYYMLFALTSTGVPSIAKIVRVT
jgi:galactose oxidase